MAVLLVASLLAGFQPGLARFGSCTIPLQRLSHGRAAPCVRARMSAEPEPRDEATLPGSLEDKMKSWEATDEERRAATFLGVVPKKLDSFELGLNIAFPIMLIACVGIAFFPFYAAQLAGDAGPPHMK